MMQSVRLKKGLINIIKYTIMAIFGVIIFYLTKISITKTSGVEGGFNGIVDDNPLMHITIFICIIIVGAVLKRYGKGFVNLSSKTITIIAFASVTFVCMCVWIYMTQMLPYGDPAEVASFAYKLANGDMTPWTKENYLEVYPNNNGITIYAYVVLLLCGKNYEKMCIALQYLNVLWMAVTMLAIYGICKLTFGSKIRAGWMYVATALYLPYVLFISYIYGTVIGMAFAMLAILFINLFFEKRKWWWGLLSAVCITFAAIMKMNYLIVMIAIIIMCVMDMIEKWDKKALINALAIVLILICYVGGSKAFNKYIELKTGYEVGEGMPRLAWIVTGLRWQYVDSPGMWDNWSEYTYKLVGCDSDAMEQQAREQLKLILEKHKTIPGYTKNFFRAKIQNAWNNPMYDSLEIYKNRTSLRDIPDWVNGLIYGAGNKKMFVIMNVLQSLILFGSLLYVLLGLKKIDAKQLIFAIIFIGGFLFHLAWEVTYLYMICYMVLIVPYAVLGFNYAFNLVNVFLDKGISVVIKRGDRR